MDGRWARLVPLRVGSERIRAVSRFRKLILRRLSSSRTKRARRTGTFDPRQVPAEGEMLRADPGLGLMGADFAKEW